MESTHISRNSNNSHNHKIGASLSRLHLLHLFLYLQYLPPLLRFLLLLSHLLQFLIRVLLLLLLPVLSPHRFPLLLPLRPSLPVPLLLLQEALLFHLPWNDKGRHQPPPPLLPQTPSPSHRHPPNLLLWLLLFLSLFFLLLLLLFLLLSFLPRIPRRPSHGIAVHIVGWCFNKHRIIKKLVAIIRSRSIGFRLEISRFIYIYIWWLTFDRCCSCYDCLVLLWPSLSSPFFSVLVAFAFSSFLSLSLIIRLLASFSLRVCMRTFVPDQIIVQTLFVPSCSFACSLLVFLLGFRWFSCCSSFLLSFVRPVCSCLLLSSHSSVFPFLYAFSRSLLSFFLGFFSEVSRALALASAIAIAAFSFSFRFLLFFFSLRFVTCQFCSRSAFCVISFPPFVCIFAGLWICLCCLSCRSGYAVSKKIRMHPAAKSDFMKKKAPHRDLCMYSPDLIALSCLAATLDQPV